MGTHVCCLLVMRFDAVGSAVLPWVAGCLYALGLVAIPLYTWLPWMALHNQREYTGGNRWVPATTIAWAIAAVSFHFLRKVLTTDPGMTPLSYTHTETDPRKRQCAICQLPKPPRAKHCSTCGRCVLAMDHHCMWLNTCVGWANRKAFIQYLTWTLFLIGYIVALCALRAYPWYILRTYHYSEAPAWHRDMDYRILRAQIPFVETLFLLIGIVILPLIALGILFLLYLQLSNVINGMTQLESWETSQALSSASKARSPITPYFPYASSSAYINASRVLGALPFLYPLHLFSTSSPGSGLAFPITPPPSQSHKDMYAM